MPLQPSARHSPACNNSSPRIPIRSSPSFSDLLLSHIWRLLPPWDLCPRSLASRQRARSSFLRPLAFDTTVSIPPCLEGVESNGISRDRRYRSLGSDLTSSILCRLRSRLLARPRSLLALDLLTHVLLRVASNKPLICEHFCRTLLELELAFRSPPG
jgi:hypothetical protein